MSVLKPKPITTNTNEPIRTRSNYMEPAQSPGKRVQTSHDWFESYFGLVEKVARDFLTNNRAK